MPTGNKKGEAPKYRNITVDADIHELLGKVASKLEGSLGFKPTISQTLRHILKGYEQ